MAADTRTNSHQLARRWFRLQPNQNSKAVGEAVMTMNLHA